MYAMFVTSPAPETPLDPRTMRDPAGRDAGPDRAARSGRRCLHPATPDSGSTYEPFQYRTLLQIAAALGIPYRYLANDMVKGNFSNSRLADRIPPPGLGLAAFVMVYQLCRPVYARWMDVAVLSGASTCPAMRARARRYQACDWLPTKWDWVDPLKDATAEIAQIEAGLKSRTPGHCRARL